MALDDTPNSSEPKSPEMAKVKKYSSQTALAMELPFTIVGAVLLGGVGTLVVIALWAWRFPELRRAGVLSDMKSVTEDASEAAERMH